MAGVRTADYLDKVERYAGRSLSRRDDLSRMIGAAGDPDGARLFDELLFLAKFCDRAFGIIRRTGPGSDEVSKLTAELASATSRISEIVGRLTGRGGDAGSDLGGNTHSVSDYDSFAHLKILIGELAVLKNFELDSGGK